MRFQNENGLDLCKLFKATTQYEAKDEANSVLVSVVSQVCAEYFYVKDAESNC
jgi:hypothetical protein